MIKNTSTHARIIWRSLIVKDDSIYEPNRILMFMLSYHPTTLGKDMFLYNLLFAAEKKNNFFLIVSSAVMMSGIDHRTWTWLVLFSNDFWCRFSYLPLILSSGQESPSLGPVASCVGVVQYHVNNGSNHSFAGPFMPSPDQVTLYWGPASSYCMFTTLSV